MHDIAIAPSVLASPPATMKPALEDAPVSMPVPLEGYTRDTIRIPSVTKGWDLAAWQYLPAGARKSGKRRPVVVLAHGLSGNKTMALDEYAAAFAGAGYAAVAFDYRGWGESDGAPRCVLDVRDQLDDYRTVVRWCREQPEFDPNRVLVWGTSFAGGHALTLAADRQLGVAGAISQCPYTGSFPRVSTGLVLAVLVALLDLFCVLLGLPKRFYIPATNTPGHAGAMTVSGSLDGMRALGGAWENRLAGASLFDVPLYNPSATAARIQCPTLVVPGLEDQIFVWRRDANPATRAPPGRVTVAEVEGDHWAVYPGQPGYEKNLGAQLAFLKKHFPL